MRDPAAHPLTLRRKPIVARELPEGEPDVIGEPIAVRTEQTPPIIEEVIASPDAPVVLATHLGRRKRRRSHARQYRWAQVATALSMLASAGAIVCLLLGDRVISWTVGALAVVLAGIGVKLAWRTGLARRVGGYAVVAAVLGIMSILLGAVAPGSWFDDSAHDPGSGRIETVKAKKP